MEFAKFASQAGNDGNIAEEEKYGALKQKLLRVFLID